MDWQERLFTFMGPGLLSGVTFAHWCRLLRDERFAVDLAHLPRALSITAQSLKNSVLQRREQQRFGALLEGITVAPPLFILGHWRHGTTHLHQLLAQDVRFAFPNAYQAAFPHIFLTAEEGDSRFLSSFMPTRRPMDNVEWTLASPQEDEFALCASTFKSPCMSWIFPRRRKHFGRYLSLRDVSPQELAQWRAALELFLKKLTWKYRRPLILKSPPHTGRIRLLLEMFPGAKFVHIHRNPHVVFQSTRKLLQSMFRWHALQRPDLSDLDEWILDQYHAMYELFFEERRLIPSGFYHEIAFEELDRDPVGELRKLYTGVNLPDFASVETAMRRYVGSLRDYKKNQFGELSPQLTERISAMWHRTIDEWGYSSP